MTSQSSPSAPAAAGGDPALQPQVFTPASAAVNLRRSTIVGVVLAVIAIVITSLMGHPMGGVFGLIGIGLGAGNNYLLQKSVLRFAQVSTVTRKQFGGRVMMRLALVTIVALAIGIFDRPDGLGVFAGLAVFQLLMLVGASLPVFRYLKPTS